MIKLQLIVHLMVLLGGGLEFRVECQGHVVGFPN